MGMAWGKLVKMQEAFLSTRHSDECDAFHHAVLGLAYRHSGRPRKALASYRTSLCLRNDDAWVWEQYAFALMDAGRYRAAVEAFETAIALDVDGIGGQRGRCAGPMGECIAQIPARRQKGAAA